MRSLQVKFSALLVTLLVVACVALALVSTRHEERALLTEVTNRGQALARALAGSVKEALVIQDDLTVGSWVNQLGEEPGVAAARVLDADGKVVAALADGEVGRVITPTRGFEGANGGLGVVRRQARLPWVSRKILLLR